MAQTESNVSGEAQLSDGDDLSETNLGSVRAQGNSVDYVERGCGFSVDHGANTIDIGNTNTRGNYAIVEEPSPHVAWDLFPDQATGISLPDTNGTNYVYIAYNTSTDQIFYHIDDDDTAPSEPALKIGTVDTANDTSTETNREPDGTFETTTTEVLNNDEEPNLDISEAWWSVFSQAIIWENNFNTLDGLEQSTSGSGSISLDNDRIDLSTGSTDASHALIRDWIAGNNYGKPSWDKDRRLFCVIRAEDTSGKLAAVTGTVAEDDYTGRHFGFRYTGGNLEATVADGTTQNTTTIDASPTTGQYLAAYAELTAGTEVKYWVDKNPNTNTPDGTLSSNLPTGAGTGVDANKIFTAISENDSATDRILRVSGARVVQMP